MDSIPSTTLRRKWKTILSLLERGQRITRFDAERHGDHALNTTVSILGKKGITISRVAVVVPGRFGEIRCNQYWIEGPEERLRARQLLDEKQ